MVYEESRAFRTKRLFGYGIACPCPNTAGTGRNNRSCARMARTMRKNLALTLSGSALAKFRKRLLAWFVLHRRDLPWRRTRNPYHIWLSEIMLQQTRAAAAIPYYQRFLQRFPDVQTLAEAPEQEVLRLWAGLGYYSRARNLQKAAGQILAKHGGEFPQAREEALALAGIGSYTAAAILSIAYGEKLAVLDGNVARVLARLGAIRGNLREAGRWRNLQMAADALLDSATPGDWNQAMMELGATVCTPRAPRCLLCPVGEFCEGRKLGLAESLPEKRKKRAPVQVRLAAAVLLDAKGRTLLLPPPLSATNGDGAANHLPSLLSKMWHFPTVSVNGSAESALRRHLRSLGASAEVQSADFLRLKDVRHAVTYRDVRVAPFRVSLKQLPHVEAGKVLPLAGLDAVPVSNLTRKVARAALPQTPNEKRRNS
jgi:A/G-specific adenine glycosylase